MQVTSNTKLQFQPIQLNITLENVEDAAAFYCIFNHIDIVDAFPIYIYDREILELIEDKIVNTELFQTLREEYRDRLHTNIGARYEN